MPRDLKPHQKDPDFRGYFMLLPESESGAGVGSISVGTILGLIWRRRLAIILFAACGTAIAGLYAYDFATKMYRSEAVIAYRDSDMAGLGGLSQQFGGLASLAGVSLPTGSSKGAEQLAVLSSKNMLKKLIVQDNIIPVLFPHPGRFFGLLPAPPITENFAAQYLMDKVATVEQDKKTTLITVSMVSKDPRLAAKWTNDLIAITNAYLRQREIGESQRNVGYLQREGATATVESVREALVQLTAKNLNQAMLANVQTDFAFKMVDPPEVRENRDFYYPNRPLFLLAGFVLGLLTGAAFALWPHRYLLFGGDPSAAMVR